MKYYVSDTLDHISNVIRKKSSFNVLNRHVCVHGYIYAKPMYFIFQVLSIFSVIHDLRK